NDGYLVALLEDVDPEAPDAGDGNREVHFQFALEFLPLFFVHYFCGDFGDFARCHRGLLEGFQHPLKLCTGRRTSAEVEVRAVVFGEDTKVVGKSHCGVDACCGWTAWPASKLGGLSK